MPVKFTKVPIADERYETAGVFDVDGDGVLDIVSGAYWYQGPEYRRRHHIRDVAAFGDYFDDFFTIPLDVNGDGRMDYCTGGWWGEELRWRENPGCPGAEWPEHLIARCGPIETTHAWDVDGDGEGELVPNTPSGPLVAYKLNREAGRGTGSFSAHTLCAEPQGHGLGFGEIAGSGRGDFVLNYGWLEAPAEPLVGEWVLHRDFELGGASIPIIVADVNGDGLGDLIVGQAHGYGLDWWEQRRDADGRRSFIKHPIDPFSSQFHDLRWADIDGDGQAELITGKRYMAHMGSDPGEYDDVGIYYYKWNGESFTKQVIDYGPPGRGKGCGLFFALADLRGVGRLDVIAGGKDGLCIYFNEGL